MVKNPQINNDEINLIELMYILWEGKWKIAVAVVISFITVISYQSTKTKNFTAITEIKPISISVLSKFTEFNSLIANTNFNSLIANTNTGIGTNISERVNVAGRFIKITSLRLLNLYIDILNDRSLFEDAIRKFNLLEASQYNNEQEYSEAIIKLASSVKILSPAVSANAKKGNSEISYHTINFTHHDAEKWISILRYVDDFGNKIVKKNLVDEYNNTLVFLENKKKYKLGDISIKINNL